MNKPPEILYHYTSIDAFKSIIENEHLRMTKYDQLNDTSEVIHAKNILVQTLKEYQCTEEQLVFKEFLLEVLSHYQNLQIFITSFSKKQNDLEQWRAYVANGGVSIGFKSQELENGFIYENIPEGDIDMDRGVVIYPNGKGGRAIRKMKALLKCKYDSKAAKTMISKSVELWFKDSSLLGMYHGVKKNQPEEMSLMFQLFRSSVSKSIYDIICTTKHSSYLREEEWRWLNICPKEEVFPKYLDEKNRLYIKAGIIPKNFIKEVWISPHGDTEGFKRAVEFYRTKYNLNFDIHESKIPYRL